MKKDRHRPGYYTEYNKKHPERLNRGYTKGYTKGYKNDNVCEGKQNIRNLKEPGMIECLILHFLNYFMIRFLQNIMMMTGQKINVYY